MIIIDFRFECKMLSKYIILIPKDIKTAPAMKS